MRRKPPQPATALPRAAQYTDAVNRFAALDAWLDKHNAACLWRTTVGNGPERALLTIECWRVGKSIVIVTRHPKGSWDLATAANTIDTADTLRDAERRVGLRCDPIVLAPRFAVNVRNASGMLPERADIRMQVKDYKPSAVTADHSLSCDDAEALALALLDASDRARASKH